MTLTYSDAAKLIAGRGQAIRPDLGRMRALAELLDHPERSYPSVHVAGTNGKSSTAQMVGAILAAHGITAGIYTSPHLQSIRERWVLAGPGEAREERGVVSGLIAPEEMASTLDYLVPFVELVESERDEDVTYFELATTLAFEWMAAKTVDVGVIETGMGGVWDATNLVDASVAILTHVAVDHALFLGPTPLDNAREKAGIIKPGAAVVSDAQEPEVAALLEERVTAAGGTLAVLGRDVHVVSDRQAVSGRLVGVEGRRGRYADLFVPLHGKHQTVNAAVAVAAAEQFLGRELDEEAVRAGLASVRMPGRLEVVGREPLVVLDGGHNPAGAAALGPAIKETFGHRRTTMVISVSADKDIAGMMAVLVPYADRLIVTAGAGARAADPEVLAAAVRPAGGVKAEIVPRLPEAIEASLSAAAPEDLVLIAGSLFAAGEARDLLVGPVE
ncbi:MAG: bifunctional folylpolyglutamate synthase/dihydrofolate synthase [Actinomycetota bacterium]